MAGQRYAELLADHAGGTLMVGMAMRQGDQAQGLIPQLTKNAPSGPAGASIDENIFDQVDIEPVPWETR